MLRGLPTRKSPRLKEYNYSNEGCYFITVCVTDRCELLGKIEVSYGILHSVLSDYGNIVLKWIPKITNKYSYIEINNFIIMPNHIHLIMSIERGRQDAAPTKISINPIPVVMGYFKYQTTKEINIPGFWQRSYHDHIIHDHDEYMKIYEYISENPLRWAEDRYNNIYNRHI
jgi:Transposase IS200 like.